MLSTFTFFSPFLFSYVGNLDRRCTEQFVEAIFSKCGKVVRCKMINAVGNYFLHVTYMCIQCCLTCKVPAGSRLHYTRCKLTFHLKIKLIVLFVYAGAYSFFTLSFIICFSFVVVYFSVVN